MYQIDEVTQQAEEDWERLQAMNYNTTQPYNPGYSDSDDRPKLKPKKEKPKLYDRIETEWGMLAEIGYLLLVFIGVFTFVAFLRVFGAGLLAGSIGLVLTMAAIVVLVCFWHELSASEYKLRVFLCLIAMSCALALSMSDQAIDLTRHYWALLQAAVITGGVTTIAAGALVMAIKHNANSEDS